MWVLPKQELRLYKHLHNSTRAFVFRHPHSVTTTLAHTDTLAGAMNTLAIELSSSETGHRSVIKAGLRLQFIEPTNNVYRAVDGCEFLDFCP